MPVVFSSTYPFDNTQELVDFMEGRIERPEEYGRYGNPTVAAAEARVAAIEGGDAAVMMSSGMAAITTTLMSMLKAGQHVVFTADVYRKTRVFANQILAKFGVESTIVAPDVAAIEDALRPNTRIIFTEAPTNPYLRVIDLEPLVALAKKRRIKTIIDATFATPVNMQPLNHGVDLVVHSTTKYFGGHNDLLGGVVIGKGPIVAAIREQMGTFGAICDPHNAYMMARGLKTLALRVERHNKNAQAIAELVESHPKVEKVWYPGLSSHPDHAVAKRYMSGFGGVVSFEVAGGLAEGTRLVDAVQIPKIAPSLGGVESLIEQPPLMSFFELAPEERAAIGIREGLIRYSAGIEDTADLCADLQRSLDAL